jgi:spermidine synthase
MAPSFEILAYDDTPLGPLCLRRRELLSRPGTVVTEVTLNHEFLMSSYITDSERALSRVALGLQRGSQLDVLVGGLGLGYTAFEALASDRVNRVEVVELLSQVIGWLNDDLIPLAAQLKSDPRLLVTAADVYALLAKSPQRTHDLVLIDVDHSPDERLGGASAAFYTRDGLLRAKEHLKPGGILGVWSYAEHSDFADALRAVFRHVHVESVTVLNDLVDEMQTDWLFFARD